MYDSGLFNNFVVIEHSGSCGALYMEIWEIYMETQIEPGPAKVSIAA
jgi:hypothetical protein